MDGGVFLELLASDADAAAFEEPVRRAAAGGAGRAAVAELERLRDLALHARAELSRHERRESELAVLFETAQDLTRIRDVDKLLHAIVRRARRILSTDVAYIALIDRDRNDTFMKVTDGMSSSAIGSTRLPLGAGLGGLVAERGLPYATSDFWSDQRLSHTAEVDHAVRSERIVSIVGVPLSIDSDVIGVLYAADRHSRVFQPEDIALLSSLAALSAVALEATRAFEDARRAADELARSHALAEQRARNLESISEAHRRLTATLLEGGGVGEAAATIGEILDTDVVVLDAEGSVLWSSQPNAPRFESGEDDDRTLDADGRVWSAVSTTARGVPLVRVLVDRAALDTTEHGVLERGATVLALVLTLGRIALGEEIRSREELLVDILVGASRDPHTIRQRAERSGMRWRGPKTVLVVRGPDHQRRAVRAAATRWIGAGDVVADHLQSIVVLVGGDQPGRAAQALAAHLETAGYPVVVGGAGPGATPEELRTRYDEAFRCAQLLAALGRSGGAQMSDLGIFGVLGVPEAAGRAVDFVERTLAPLLEYDAAHDGRLVATLAT
ncbi:MAG TPA: GAF domain-containing protein, partial [Aldersonia sp.]